MSWRRFLVLLAGLSPESRWQHALAGDRDGASSTPLEGAAGQAYFDQLAGGPA